MNRYKNKYIKLLEDYKDMETRNYTEKFQTAEVLDLITDFIHDNWENPTMQKLYKEIDNYYDECKKNTLSREVK